MSESPEPRSGWPKFLLILLPIWLLASGGIALWYYFHREKQQSQIEQARFAQAVSTPMLEDDLKKIVQVIGERNGSSETAAANLSRTASMIEGLLGPSNTGYTVQKHRGPADWPILEVSVKGKIQESPAVWVVTTYDSPLGSPGAEANATGLAATLAAAQALAADKPTAAVHFVFFPHGNDRDSPVMETCTKFLELTKATSVPTRAVLVVEAMGAGESLWLSSRDTSAIPLNFVSGIGSIHGAEDICLSDDTDLASSLFEMNLPAVRVSTRAQVTADQKDAELPFAPTVAASTGRLIELIRRCAAPPKK